MKPFMVFVKILWWIFLIALAVLIGYALLKSKGG